MGIQHQGAHARKLVQLRKRDVDVNDNLHRFIHRPEHNTNHGGVKMNVPADFDKPKVAEHNTNHGGIKMHVPEGFSSSVDTADKSMPTVANKAQVDEDVDTVYSVVYQTMSQTFDGEPAGFSTEGSTPTPTNVGQVGAQTATAAAASNTQDADQADYESRKAAAQGTTQASSTAASSTSIASAEPTHARDPAAQHAAAIAKQSSSSAAATSTGSSDPTVAVGGAGMAESDGPSVVAAAPVQATRSPAASSHEMSSGTKAGIAFGVIIGLGLLAGLIFCMRRKKNKAASQETANEKSYDEKAGFHPQTNRFSSDSDKRSSTQTSATAPRLSLRPVTQFLPNLSNNRASSGNALGSLANTPMHEKPNSAWERRPAGQNPFNDAAVLSENQANPFDENDSERAASAQSQHSDGSNGTAAAFTVAKDVHRVQLDFKPSMDDELELLSGQLVRMLHEYDDGWALCIRMDRTQQGVVPRTCLSKLPVKPRGPPRSNHSSQSSGSMSNGAAPSGALAPRPLTPRDGSPASSQQANGSVSRKPVPGMAM